MKNSSFDRFVENWMNGGADARASFLLDLHALLEAERERCAVLVETFVGRRYGRTGVAPSTELHMKRVAEEIRDLV